LLAPFLADSPCLNALHANILKRKQEIFPTMMIGSSVSSMSAGRRSGARSTSSAQVDYSVSRMDHVWLARVAPLVDRGLMDADHGVGAVGSQLAELIKLATDHGRVGGDVTELEDAVDVRAILPLMFGQVSRKISFKKI
jgi:hypothetical protein